MGSLWDWVTNALNAVGGGTQPKPSQATTLPAPTPSGFFGWAAGFAVLALVLIALSDRDDTAEAAAVMTWLIAMGATFYWWNDFNSGLAEILGRRDAQGNFTLTGAA